MEAMKGSVTGKDLNLLSEQLGKDAVTRVHRLELENQRLQRELEAAKTDLSKVELQPLVPRYSPLVLHTQSSLAPCR